MTDDRTMLKRPYEIVPYNPLWPEKFEGIKQDVQQSFGSKAFSIEHMGSTSIVGMPAKGVIDVRVLVDHMESFEKEKHAMIDLGYKYDDEYIGPDSVFIYKEKPDLEKTVNIHVFAKGSPYEEKFILTRDYFRTHPERVQMYKDLKIKLYQEFPDDYPAYRAGKQDFLGETLELARNWKLEQNQ